MIGVTVFGLVFTPVFYVVFRAISERLPKPPPKPPEVPTTGGGPTPATWRRTSRPMARARTSHPAAAA